MRDKINKKTTERRHESRGRVQQPIGHSAADLLVLFRYCLSVEECRDRTSQHSKFVCKGERDYFFRGMRERG